MITFAITLMVFLLVLGALLGWLGFEALLDWQTAQGSALLVVGAFIIGLGVLIMLRLLDGGAL